jgi:hypothetical protein
MKYAEITGDAVYIATSCRLFAPVHARLAMMHPIGFASNAKLLCGSKQLLGH